MPLVSIFSQGENKQKNVAGLIKNYLKSLKPSLLNCCRRMYFQSADHKYRITIGFDMEYYRVAPANNYFLSKTGKSNHTILELKYLEKDNDKGESITSLFPVRMTKSSIMFRVDDISTVTL